MSPGICAARAEVTVGRYLARYSAAEQSYDSRERECLLGFSASLCCCAVMLCWVESCSAVNLGTYLPSYCNKHYSSSTYYLLWCLLTTGQYSA